MERGERFLKVFLRLNNRLQLPAGLGGILRANKNQQSVVFLSGLEKMRRCGLSCAWYGLGCLFVDCGRKTAG